MKKISTILAVLMVLFTNFSKAQDYFDVPYVGEPDSVSLATALSLQPLSLSVNETNLLREDISYKYTDQYIGITIFSGRTNFYLQQVGTNWVVPESVRAVTLNMNDTIPFFFNQPITYAYITNADVIGDYDLVANGRVMSNLGGRGVLLLGQIMAINGKGLICVGLHDGTMVVYSLKEGGISYLSRGGLRDDNGYVHIVGVPDRIPISSLSDLLAYAKTIVNNLQGLVYQVVPDAQLVTSVPSGRRPTQAQVRLQSLRSQRAARQRILGRKVIAKRVVPVVTTPSHDVIQADCSGFSPSMSGIRIFPDNISVIGFVNKAEVIEVRYTSSTFATLPIDPDLPSYMKPSAVYVSTDCRATISSTNWMWFPKTTPAHFITESGHCVTIRFKP